MGSQPQTSLTYSSSDKSDTARASVHLGRNDSNLDFQRTRPLSRRLQRRKFYFAVAVARTALHTRAYRSCTVALLSLCFSLFFSLRLCLASGGRFERTSGKVYREATNGWQLGDASVAICIGVGRVETSRPFSLSLSLSPGLLLSTSVSHLLRALAKTSREGRELTALPLPAARPETPLLVTARETRLPSKIHASLHFRDLFVQWSVKKVERF